MDRKEIKRADRVPDKHGHYLTMAERLAPAMSYTPRGFIPYHDAQPIERPDMAALAARGVTRSSPAFLGRLGQKLPLELILMIVEQLSPRTAGRFAQASSGALKLVWGSKVYREVAKVLPLLLPGILGSFKQSRESLLFKRSLRSLHATLLSQKCVKCNENGALLFVPTAERCCYNCFRTNPSLWVIPHDMARTVFLLKDWKLELHLTPCGTVQGQHQAPTVRIGPASFDPYSGDIYRVKDVRELALKVHGSMDKLFEKVVHGGGFGVNSICHYLFSDIVRPRQRWKTLEAERLYNFQSVHMGVFAWPWLAKSGRIEAGHWCYGCQWLIRNFFRVEEDVSSLCFQGLGTPESLRYWSRKTRTADELVEHVELCFGARHLWKDLRHQAYNMVQQAGHNIVIT